MDIRGILEASWRGVVFVLALLILVVITVRWHRWEGRAGWQTSDDAYLQSDFTPIAAKVSGYIRSAPLQDFEHVRSGQLLAEIVDDDYRATVAQAEAGVQSAQAQVAAYKAQKSFQAANVVAAKAVVASTKANLNQNARDVARQNRLLATGSSTTEASEKLATLGAQLSAQLAQNEAQADAAAKQISVIAAQQGQAEATVKSQQAALQLARINLGYTRIVAPQDGVVGQRQVRIGQFVGVGGQVTSLIPLPNVWVIANFKETQLTHMVVGEKAEVFVDTFPGHRMRGHLIGFSPGSGSQFALLPPDNATGNFTKIVQRVAVKIGLDDEDGLADRLKSGMSVIARIDAQDGDQR